MHTRNYTCNVTTPPLYMTGMPVELWKHLSWRSRS